MRSAGPSTRRDSKPASLQETQGDSQWLGRKDSNLQPSDPESAALPLRHSPSVAGRTILRTSRGAAGYSWIVAAPLS